MKLLVRASFRKQVWVDWKRGLCKIRLAWLERSRLHGILCLHSFKVGANRTPDLDKGCICWVQWNILACEGFATLISFTSPWALSKHWQNCHFWKLAAIIKLHTWIYKGSRKIQPSVFHLQNVFVVAIVVEVNWIRKQFKQIIFTLNLKLQSKNK